GYIIYPERGRGEPESLILGTDPRRGLDFYDKPDGEALHLADWLGAIRSRSKPSCPAEAGVAAASAAHLGNRAAPAERGRKRGPAGAPGDLVGKPPSSPELIPIGEDGHAGCVPTTASPSRAGREGASTHDTTE